MRDKQLICELLYQIYALLIMDHSQTEMAKVIHKHKGAINREIKHKSYEEFDRNSRV